MPYSNQASILFALGSRLAWQAAIEYAWKLRILNGLARLEQGKALYPVGQAIDWDYSADYLPDICWHCDTSYGLTTGGRIRYGCPACGHSAQHRERPLEALANILDWPTELMEQLYLQWLAAKHGC